MSYTNLVVSIFFMMMFIMFSLFFLRAKKANRKILRRGCAGIALTFGLFGLLLHPVPRWMFAGMIGAFIAILIWIFPKAVVQIKRLWGIAKSDMTFKIAGCVAILVLGSCLACTIFSYSTMEVVRDVTMTTVKGTLALAGSILGPMIAPIFEHGINAAGSNERPIIQAQNPIPGAGISDRVAPVATREPVCRATVMAEVSNLRSKQNPSDKAGTHLAAWGTVKKGTVLVLVPGIQPERDTQNKQWFKVGDPRSPGIEPWIMEDAFKDPKTGQLAIVCS
jgi:hypothetical protein